MCPSGRSIQLWSKHSRFESHPFFPGKISLYLPHPLGNQRLEFKALGRTINTFALLYHTSLSIRVTGLCVFYSQFVNEDSSKTPSSKTHLSRVHQTSKQLLNKVSNENTIQQVFLKAFQQNTAWWKPSLGLKLVYTLFEVGDCNFTQYQQFDHTYTKQQLHTTPI